MKRKSMITMLVIALMLVLSLTVLSACGKNKDDNKDDPPAKYSVTVTNGTGGGEYAEGATVKIKANAPATGKEFTSWTIEGVTVDDKTKAEITFTMPANAVTATANYGDKAYLFALENCTADKETAKFGEQVTFTADEVIGKRFDSWNIKGVDDLTGLDLTKSPLTITMPANDIVVAAQLEDIEYEVFVPTGSGTADKVKAKYGETVTVTADETTPVREFASWHIIEGLDATGLDLTKPILQFEMPACKVHLIATYNYIHYKVTVVGGTAQMDADAEPTSEVWATYECPVSIFADNAPTGKRFVRWTSTDGVVFDSETSENTSFEMPAKNVTVTAEFEYIDYEIKVTGGKAKVNGGVASASVKAHYGDTVTITAAAPETGKRFTDWTITGVDTSELVLTNKELTFTMPAGNVTATANYVIEDYEIKVTGGAAQVNDGGPFSTNAAHYGDNVKIKAHNPGTGMKFKNWTITGVDTSELVLTNEELTFIMPAGNVTATANYEYIDYTVTVVYGTAQVNDGVASASVKAHYGEEVTITADEITGMEFMSWTINGVSVDDKTKAEITFTMPAGNVTAKANYVYNNYKVTVNGGTANKTTAHYGDSITITAEVPVGKEFVMWSFNGLVPDGLTLTDAELTFTMPANDVTATAELRDLVKRSVTVQGGVAQVGEGTQMTSLKAYCGDTVTLTAYQDPDKTFVKWTIEGIDTEGLDLTQRELTFTMPENDVTATAEFENVPTELTFEGNTATSGELWYVNYDSKSFRLTLGDGQDLCTYTIELSNSAFTFKVYGSGGEVYINDDGEGVKSITIDREDNYTIEVINTGKAANCTLTVTKV